MARDPETREQWQEAVDAAAFMVMLHAARLYGLVEGGPDVDCERADDLLKRGERRGITPSPDLLKQLLGSEEGGG